MNADRKSIDWLAFFTRIIGVGAVMTLMFVDRLRRHNLIGAIVVAVTGYVVLPALVYMWGRFDRRASSGN